MPLAGTQLSIPQIYGYAVQGGFPAGRPAALATATAMLESGGYTGAVSSSGATGLWQLIHGHWGGRSAAQITDPLTNAQIAASLWKARGGESVPEATAWADWWPYDQGPSNPRWGSLFSQASAASGSSTAVLTSAPGPTAPGLPGQDIATWFLNWLVGGNEQAQVGNALAQEQSQAGPWAFLVEPVTAAGSFLETVMKYLPGFLTHIFMPSTWVRVSAVTVGTILTMVGVFLFFSRPGAATSTATDLTRVIK